MRNNALQLKLMKLINSSGNFAFELKAIVRKKVYDQLSVYDNTIKEKDIDEYLKDENKMNEVIQNTVYGGGASVKVENALNDMKEKIDEIKRIDKNVKTLLDMILHLQTIIQSNSELVNSIDSNMALVVDYMEVGVDELAKGKVEYSSAMDKFCCCFMIVLVAMIISLNYLFNQIPIIGD